LPSPPAPGTFSSPGPAIEPVMARHKRFGLKGRLPALHRLLSDNKETLARWIRKPFGSRE
jgi:hypothetical protein